MTAYMNAMFLCMQAFNIKSFFVHISCNAKQFNAMQQKKGNACMRTCVCIACMYVSIFLSIYLKRIYARMYACICVCLCININIYIYTSIFICMYACIYLSEHACMQCMRLHVQLCIYVCK